MAYNSPQERFEFYKGSRLAVNLGDPVESGLFDKDQLEKFLTLQKVLREAENINDVLELSQGLGSEIGHWVEKDVLKNFGEIGLEKEPKLR
ncbi:MAG: hypothetical protein UX26_C0015G0005 [Parcubacteria group bacterium GW2011_GWC1_45_9]|nr:MAG: hypothetical protein UW85_C0002G0009 [Parcubacteria group bacterium GW2011_GWA1_Parcubacteria_45_10]KKT88197.1 MAG: hypothetical protein UW89_C0010G0008 [Parcubacteria group bacterium GW2011_GWB1_45_10]KKU16832.1 MAG: hypothetical protein UX26_C0015G0005 [Parcubacteria group bacterium GW2011_GWC1_45_9]HCI05577.1 hypothetical protein [Patescibacteria group bacterium]